MQAVRDSDGEIILVSPCENDPTEEDFTSFYDECYKRHRDFHIEKMSQMEAMFLVVYWDMFLDNVLKELTKSRHENGF